MCADKVGWGGGSRAIECRGDVTPAVGSHPRPSLTLAPRQGSLDLFRSLLRGKAQVNMQTYFTCEVTGDRWFARR